MTEVVIHISDMDELKVILQKVQELKKGNPYTKFRIEIS